MPMKKCPVCGVHVKAENLEGHVKKQHPREKVDLRSVLSEEERHTVIESKSHGKPGTSRKVVGLIATVTVISVIVVVIATLPPSRSVGPGVGQFAPDFTLRTSDGNYVTLSSNLGKSILLAFVDIDGAPCRAECEILASVYATYSTRVFFFSIDVDFVSPEDTVERINDFRTSKNTPWSYALDPDKSVTSAYNVNARPNVFIIDKEGVVRRTFVGPAPNGYSSYATALNDVLNG